MKQFWTKLLIPNIAASAMFLLPVTPHQQIWNSLADVPRVHPSAIPVSPDDCHCAAEAAAEYFEAAETADSSYLVPQPLSQLTGFTYLIEQSA